MLVDEMMTSSSFVKKNNSYSHCPLKKRPVPAVMPTAEELKPAKMEIKEEAVDIVDDAQEPENLSTKPEDLRKTAPKRQRSPSPILHHYPAIVKRSASPEPLIASPKAKRSASPASMTHYHHSFHQPQPSPPMAYQLNYPLYPTKANSPPSATMPIHPAAKRVRVEVLKHDSGSPTSTTTTTAAAPLHFMATAPASPEYITAYGRPAPIHPTPLLPYAPYCYPESVYSGFSHHHQPQPQHHHHVPAYASPEHHQSISPSPPHPGAVSSYRPLVGARSHHYWPSPEHCGLSPTGSLGSSVSSSLRSPPLVTPEDLSSPGSDSGRSSAGSITVGSCSSINNNNKFNNNNNNNKSQSDKHSSPDSPGSSPRYQCPDCQKSYSTYSGLTKHQQFHCSAAEGQAKKSFSCKNCDKVYYTLGALKMHIRTHTLPCKCDICGKAFSRPWLLQGHIRTHTGEKPFVCQHCNRAFADRSNLRAHLQTHSDVKKYSCSSCSKTFSRMSLLTKHQEGGCPGVAVPVPVPYGC